MRSRLTQKEKARILQMLDEGFSAEKTAREIGRCKKTVETYRRKARNGDIFAETPGWRRWEEEEEKLLASMVENGVPLKEIAQKLGRSEIAVQGKCKHLEITQQRNTHPTPTICWDCKRNALNCPWIGKHKAVKGWKAVKMPYLRTYSYRVEECPLFERVERRVVDDDEEDLF